MKQAQKFCVFTITYFTLTFYDNFFPVTAYPLSLFSPSFQREFLHLIFSGMGLFQDTYSVPESFLNLASNSRQYLDLLLTRRYKQKQRIVYIGELKMNKLRAETLACRLLWRVNTSSIVSYRQSLLPASFKARSHHWQQ
jgi:hypothetical protein